MTTNTLKIKTVAKLIAVVLLAGSVLAHGQETPIHIALEDGKPSAQFNVGDSQCVLKDDQIRCTPRDK